MSEDVAARRAAALESALMPENDPAERETADRIRALLAHPATWASAPDIALPRAELAAEPGLVAATRPATGEAPVAADVSAAEPGLVVEAGSVVATGPATGEAPVAADVSVAEPGSVVEPGSVAATEPPSGEAPVAADVSVAEEKAGAVSGSGDASVVEPGSVVDLARRRRVRRTVSWAAAVATVAAAVLVMSLLLVPSSGPTGPAPESFQLALAGTGQVSEARASVIATKLTAGWEFTLDVAGLPAAPQGTYYQGWVLRGETVVPLGTFHMRQPGVVRLWAGVAVDEFARVEITRQQVGASGERGELMMTGLIPHR